MPSDNEQLAGGVWTDLGLSQLHSQPQNGRQEESLFAQCVIAGPYSPIG